MILLSVSHGYTKMGNGDWFIYCLKKKGKPYKTYEKIGFFILYVTLQSMGSLKKWGTNYVSASFALVPLWESSKMYHPRVRIG